MLAAGGVQALAPGPALFVAPLSVLSLAVPTYSLYRAPTDRGVLGRLFGG